MLCNCFHCFKLFTLLKLEHSSPSHCSNIAFYDSSNWTVLPRLHGSSIASTIPQIGHSSLDSIAAPLLAVLTSDIPLSNHELNCFHCFPSFCIAQILDIPFWSLLPLLPLLSTQDIPLSNHELHCLYFLKLDILLQSFKLQVSVLKWGIPF
jgi:hypothetical protein